MKCPWKLGKSFEWLVFIHMVVISLAIYIYLETLTRQDFSLPTPYFPPEKDLIASGCGCRSASAWREKSNMNTVRQTADEGLTRVESGIGHHVQSRRVTG